MVSLLLAFNVEAEGTYKSPWITLANTLPSPT